MNKNLLCASVALISFASLSYLFFKTNTQKKITIGFLGDLMLGRGVNEELKKKSPASIWGNVLPFLKNTTLNIANLETALTLHNEPVPKVFNFKSDPVNVKVLQEANIAIVNLANNHVMDFNVEGMKETLETLHAAQIKTVGAGLTAAQAQQPVIVSYNDITLGVIGFTDNEPTWIAEENKPGTNYVALESYEAIVDQIKRLRSHVDILIVSTHWGGNWPSEPTLAMRTAAHALVDAGADIIHGHSAHVTLGIEYYRNSLILYSTGDFIDDYAIDPIQRNDRSFIYEVTVSKKGIQSLQLIPVILTYAQTNKASDEEALQMIQRAIEQSAALGTTLSKAGSWKRP